MSENWLEYKCKAGQTRFYCNKTTGELMWPIWDTVQRKWSFSGQPIHYKPVGSTHHMSTQTNDTGCINGCSSVFVEEQTAEIRTDVTTEKKALDIHLTTTGENKDENSSGNSNPTDQQSNTYQYSAYRTLEKLISLIESEINSVNDKSSELIHSTVTQNDIDHKQDKSTNDQQLLTANRNVKHSEHKTTKAIRKGSHTGKMPFKCAFCSKYFVYKSQYIRHERIHTDEKPYKCSFCWKVFSRADHCRQHERTHTGEKPYNCTHCKMAFAYNKVCKNHERCHTREKPFQCLFCKRCFSRKDHCKEHELRMHFTEI